MPESHSLNCSSPAFAQISAELLGNGITLRFRAQGISMHPLIRDGDILTVEPIQSEVLRVGDVVLFVNHQDRPILHRIVRRHKSTGINRYILQGDRVRYIDGIIPQSEILGKLASLERDGCQIEMDESGMHILGWMAVIHSRFRFGESGPIQWAYHLIKQTKFFEKYLT